MSLAGNIVVQDNDVAETNVYLQLQCLPSGNWIVQLATQCICMSFEAVQITCTFGRSGEYGGFESSFGTF